MKRFLSTLPLRFQSAVVLAVAVATSASEADENSRATLQWRNGDRLTGRLLDVNRSRLRWQSPFFASPLWIDLDALESAGFPETTGPPRITEPHRFTTRSGDVFYGRLVELTEDHVVAKSERHGECRMPRSQVLGFRRCYGVARYAALEELYIGRSRVQLVDGTVLHGTVRRLDRSTGVLVVKELSGVRQLLRTDEVHAVYLGDDDAGDVSGDPQVQIAYHDGTRLRGTIASSAPGKLLVETVYSRRAVACPLVGVRELTFLHDEEPAGEVGGLTGRLVFDGGALHAALAESGESDGALLWRLVGSANASSLTANRPARVTFDAGKEGAEAVFDDLVPGAGVLKDRASSDVLFLRNGDVVPCRFLSVDETHLQVNPAFAAQEASIPRSQVKAIEFDSRLHLPVSGFGGRGWKVTGAAGAVERTEEQVVFRGQGTLGHMNVLHGEEVRFDIHWNTNLRATLSIDPFTRLQSGRQPGLLLYFQSNQLLVRRIQRHGNQFHVVAMQATPTRDGRATVRIALENETLRVFVDGRPLVSEPFPEALRIGNGLQLGLHPQRQIMLMNGQPVRRRAPVAQAQSALLTISNFEAGHAGTTRRLRVDEEKKRLVLTVPRQRKKNPPTHVLIARNRDVLRGRLTGATGDVIRFTSRLEDLTVPRERLAGVIWLDEVEAEEPRSSGPVDGAVRVVLANGATLTFTPERVANGKIVGRSGLLGPCRVPLSAIHRLALGGYTEDDERPAYADWRLVAAREPQFAAGSGGAGRSPGSGLASPLVGQDAVKIDVELLGGGRFDLRDHSDKVVILDFWATWCGPCVRALPQIMKTVAAFPRDEVLLLAVNQHEPAATVREFLKRRRWYVQVALDRDGRVGREFQVDAIPQTVVIGRSGRIEWLHVGAHPDLEKTLEEVLRKLLATEPSE